MKKILLITVAALFIMGCRKDKQINAASIGLTGNWEYRGTSCYCLPPADTNAYKPGNGTGYTFAISTYKHYTKHVLDKSGTYSVLPENVNGKTLNRIIFDGDTGSEAKYVTIANNRLSIGVAIGSAADAPEDHYEKQ